MTASGGPREDQRKQHDERPQPQPPRVHARDDERACDDSRRQTDDDRQHATPDDAECRSVHPHDVGVERHFYEDERRIEDAIGEEEQGKRDRDRRETVPERAVDDGGDESDGG